MGDINKYKMKLDNTALESNIGKIFNALNISWDVQK